MAAGSIASAGGVAEHGGDLLADQLEDQRLALCRRRPGEAPGEGAARPARRGGGRPDEAARGAAAAVPPRRAARRAPSSSGDGQGQRQRPQPGPSSSSSPWLVAERADAAAGEPLAVGLVEAAGHAAALPHSPQAIEVAGCPSARRWAARASRKELAAA